MKTISVIGAGSFGTALSVVLFQNRHRVKLWAREKEIVSGINTNHQNPAYLTDIKLPGEITAFSNIKDTLEKTEMVVFATPSHAMREVAKQVLPFLKGDELIVSVAKGIEKETFYRPSQILADVLEPKILEDQIGVLSGPSHAEEVALHKPTTVVSSAYSQRVAREIQQTFLTPMFRIYLNYDIAGVEIGGAVKNIMAIAAGIVDGAELGDNAKAALITRGLHEMKRMGLEFGASPETFSGLSGMGDLIVTCTSTHSRNRFVGYHIGQGKQLKDITGSMNMIAEGVKTANSVYQWSKRNHIDMPLTEAVYNVLFNNVDSKDALRKLMTRDVKEESSI